MFFIYLTTMTLPTHSDRNFDDVADHFANKVYGGLKGQIRLAVLNRDLDEYLPAMSTALGRPLRILDIGAGLAQISLRFARMGHDCTINDLSTAMLDKAKQAAHHQHLHDCHFITCPFQELPNHLTGQFDVILCHALLEWLANPQEIMTILERYLRRDGIVSLCFYNPAAPIYRNLIMGNFNHLNNPKPTDKRTLTPTRPVELDTVKTWLAQEYAILCESGIRTFYDYTPHKRGGLANPDAVIDMELTYSRQLPFRLMGRYLHILAKRK